MPHRGLLNVLRKAIHIDSQAAMLIELRANQCASLASMCHFRTGVLVMPYSVSVDKTYVRVNMAKTFDAVVNANKLVFRSQVKLGRVVGEFFLGRCPVLGRPQIRTEQHEVCRTIGMNRDRGPMIADDATSQKRGGIPHCQRDQRFFMVILCR